MNEERANVEKCWQIVTERRFEFFSSREGIKVQTDKMLKTA